MLLEKKKFALQKAREHPIVRHKHGRRSNTTNGGSAAVLSLVETGDDASQRGRQRGEAWSQTIEE